MVSQRGERRVYPHLAPRLRILHLHDSHIGQLGITAVIDTYAHDVVLAGGYLQCILEPLSVLLRLHEIRKHESRTALLKNVGQITERLRERRPSVLRNELYQLADYHQDMRTTLLRGNELLDAVAEKDASHLVVVLRSGKSEHGGDFGDDVLLQFVRRTEHTRTADIDQQHHGQLALLLITLDVRTAAAGGDIPVDVAHVVPHTVLAHFAESHAAPLEGAVVMAGENVIAQSARLYLYLAYLPEYVAAVALHIG